MTDKQIASARLAFLCGIIHHARRTNDVLWFSREILSAQLAAHSCGTVCCEE